MYNKQITQVELAKIANISPYILRRNIGKLLQMVLKDGWILDEHVAKMMNNRLIAQNRSLS